MTEEEVRAELALVNTAILNILKTGKRYVIESGPSRREFEAEKLDEYRNLRAELERRLTSFTGYSGFVGGF